MKDVNGTVELASDWKELMPVDSAKVPTFEHHISGLSPRTSYEIEITACNDVGWSEANQRFIFTTSSGKCIPEHKRNCVIAQDGFFNEPDALETNSIKAIKAL